MDAERNLRALRDALGATPGNVPLRRHLAEVLLGLGRAEEASEVLREGLRLAPTDEGLRLALADAFVRAGKRAEASVLLEDLVRRSSVPGPAYLLHARLLLAEGDAARAVREYRKALDFDPDLADAELAATLGVGAREEDADEEVVEGRVRQAGGVGEDRWQGIALERPSTRFADVGGMETLKEEIRLQDHPSRSQHPETVQGLRQARSAAAS